MIYFDNAATTDVKPEVISAMLPYYGHHFGNASSRFYSLGRDSHDATEKARETIASCLGCDAGEIYFTSCGSESDNWAIKGICDVQLQKGKNKIITSQIEHHAILHTCKYMEKHGFDVVYLPVDEDGIVSVDNLKEALDDKTALVTIMFANNEVGTIEPIKELCAIAHEAGALFHTDAVQAAGSIEVNIKDLGVDLLSISAHKFHGPKGIGALYVKKGVKITNLIHGGGQERNKRAGTENVPYIVGMATALKMACDNMEKNSAHITALRDKIINGIEEKIPHVKLNGHRTKRLPGNVNFSFKYIEGESLLLWLDINDFAVSSGSACASGSLDPSHVLLAMGLNHETAHGSLRISLGDMNNDYEAEKLLKILPDVVNRLRMMSPLYEEETK